jgi:hypothetical protein
MGPLGDADIGTPAAGCPSPSVRTTTVVIMVGVIAMLALATVLLVAIKRFGFGVAGLVDAATEIVLSCSGFALRGRTYAARLIDVPRPRPLRMIVDADRAAPAGSSYARCKTFRTSLLPARKLARAQATLKAAKLGCARTNPDAGSSDSGLDERVARGGRQSR